MDGLAAMARFDSCTAWSRSVFGHRGQQGFRREASKGFSDGDSTVTVVPCGRCEEGTGDPGDETSDLAPGEDVLHAMYGPHQVALSKDQCVHRACALGPEGSQDGLRVRQERPTALMADVLRLHL